MVKPTVLYLEPKRAANTAGCVFMALVAIGVAVAAMVYRTDTWPPEWRPTTFTVSEQTVWIVFAVAAVLALAFLIGAFVNGRRWHTARVVTKLSESPRFGALYPDTAVPPPAERAAMIPSLDVRFVKPQRYRRTKLRYRKVTADANVIGRRPLRIAFLRVFENQPRMRTFIEGAWREFGYVMFLRSAAAVTPAELKAARRTNDLAAFFVSDRDRLVRELDIRSVSPNGRGRYRFNRIGPTTIRVRDRYGSYPVRPVLCHGTYWKAAVDTILEQVDLVVLDLSGYQAKNAGTRYELQRVIDRIPVERVVFLADQRSKKRFINAELQRAWSQMAPNSPNAGAGARWVLVAITDYYRSSHQQTSGGTDQVYVRLVASRRQTRKLAVAAQQRIDDVTALANARPAP